MYAACVLLLGDGQLLLEGQLLAAPVHDDGVSRVELAADDAAGERVLDVAPDGPGQRPRAELRVVALLGYKLLGRLGDLDRDPLALQVLVHALEHDADDLEHVLATERLEDDDLVDPVYKLGAEGPL